MTLTTILKLGRVSNLPTVWTNLLAGAALTGHAFGYGPMILAGLALSAFYVGGMWLNDAFDAEIDAKERAARPIPQGEIARGAVFVVGFALLALGLVLAVLAEEGAGVVGVALAVSVLAYDGLHKKTVLAPVIMGITRVLCYVMGAMAVGTGPSDEVQLGALGLFAWVVGLTYAAKQEAYDRLERAWPLAVLAVPALLPLLWAVEAPMLLAPWIAMLAVMAGALRLLFRRAPGDVPKAVVTLIAGMSLYDAVMITAAGAPLLAVLAALGFGLTLALQRFAPGT
ncbi:MAG: UbiA family prenyltransferase [Pseudomonadota bacterium]